MSKDVLKIIAGAFLIFGFIFAYTQEVPKLQNTLDFRSLMLSAVLIGALLGLAIGYFLGRERREILERFQMALGLLVFTILLMPLLVSWTNRAFAYQTPQTEQLELLRVEQYAGSRFGRQAELRSAPDGYRIFVLREGQILRLQYPRMPFPNKEKGDLVPITVSKGLWGFEFVDW